MFNLYLYLWKSGELLGVPAVIDAPKLTYKRRLSIRIIAQNVKSIKNIASSEASEYS
jgi:hypothetical protein